GELLHEAPVALPELEVDVEAGGDLALERGLGGEAREDALGEHLERAVEERGGELLLALEVLVEGGAGDVGEVEDVLDAHRAEAALAEDGFGGHEDALGRRGTLPQLRSRPDDVR